MQNHSRKPNGRTGIEERHSRDCPAAQKAGDCTCQPSYRAWVWDKRRQRRIRKTFATVRDAKAWRADATSLLRRGALQAPSRLTLREAAEEWLAGAAAEPPTILSRSRRPYKPSALRGYRSDLERYIYPELGALRLSEVTADDVQALVDRLLGSGLSGSKVRNVIVPLQALYRRHRRQVLADPTDGLDLPEPGGRRERAAKPAEAEELLAALPEGLQALYATAFYAGLRRGELRALRVTDLRDLVLDRKDDPRGEGGKAISVAKAWDDYVGEIAPKSRAGIRDVPVPEILHHYLVAHLERTGRSGKDFLFGRVASAPFTPSHVRKTAAAAWGAANEKEAEKAEEEKRKPKLLVPIGLHECRHSYSTWLDEAGISDTRADRYMGHSDSGIRGRYRHPNDRQLLDDARRFDAYLAGAVAGKVVSLPSAEAAS